jgi:hypothetical protein
MMHKKLPEARILPDIGTNEGFVISEVNGIFADREFEGE